MINKLHLAMIELYRGDSKRIQHFCKVHSYAKLIAELSKDLGEAMVGINEQEIEILMAERGK
jgi:pyridoxal biosynthesis lyase PdxS